MARSTLVQLVLRMRPVIQGKKGQRGIVPAMRSTRALLLRPMRERIALGTRGRIRLLLVGRMIRVERKGKKGMMERMEMTMMEMGVMGMMMVEMTMMQMGVMGMMMMMMEATMTQMMETTMMQTTETTTMMVVMMMEMTMMQMTRMMTMMQMIRMETMTKNAIFVVTVLLTFSLFYYIRTTWLRMKVYRTINRVQCPQEAGRCEACRGGPSGIGNFRQGVEILAVKSLPVRCRFRFSSPDRASRHLAALRL
jgi:hypothetical protein